MQSLTQPKNSESTVDTVLKVFEAAQGLVGDKDSSNGSSKDGSNWVDVIRDLIKAAPDAIKPMLEARMAAMQAAQPKATAAPIPRPSIAPAAGVKAAPSTPLSNPVTESVSSAASTANEGDGMLAMFMPIVKENLAKVVGWAEKNRDPQIYADVLVDELPDGFGDYIPITQVLEYLNNPQWFETICFVEPRLAPYQEWCNECRLAIIEIMKEFAEELSPPNPDAASVTEEKIITDETGG